MNSSQILTDGVSDERAWRASSIDDTTAWYYPLSEDCLSSFKWVIRDAQRNSRPITEISYVRLPCPMAAANVFNRHLMRSIRDVVLLSSNGCRSNSIRLKNRCQCTG